MTIEELQEQADNLGYRLVRKQDVDLRPSRYRWNCDDNGCYMKKCEPNLGVFYDCFGGQISFSDIDGIVEHYRAALYLEWKGPRGILQEGQSIMFRNLTKQHRKNLALVVHGDPVTMEVEKMSYFYDGTYHDYRSANLGDVKTMMNDWYKAVHI